MLSSLLAYSGGHKQYHALENLPGPATRSKSPFRTTGQYLQSRGRKLAKLLTIVTCLLLAHRFFFAAPQRPSANYTIDLSSIHEDDTHRILRNSYLAPRSSSALRIKAYDAMSDECVEQWVVNQYWGPACIDTDLSPGLTLDGVWTWVNGSDPVQIASRESYRPSGAMRMDATHRYTERNELLYSMRSALGSLGANVMQRTHVLASAYPLSSNGTSNLMIGQVPAWLEKNEALSKDDRVILHHDTEFFSPVTDRGSGLTTSEIDQWREAAIPSFNSLAVESQIFNLEDTGSDQLVYYCDDFFALRPLAVSDFTTPLYGPVIRTLPRLTSMYLPSKSPIQRILNPSGEETGIKRAAWVLGQRFSLRPYYYITHHPRTLWLPLLREAVSIPMNTSLLVSETYAYLSLLGSNISRALRQYGTLPVPCPN